MNITKRVFGGFILMIGLGDLYFIMSNLHHSTSLIPSLIFSSAAIYVGVKWLFEKKPTSGDKP